MVIKTGCQCFMCRHQDEPRVLAGYMQGYIDGAKGFLLWAKDNNIKRGHIEDNDLGGLVAQLDWNVMGAQTYLNDLPDIEKEEENGHEHN